jgi:deoxyadenosine/deoxycytidine kinase
MLQKRANEYTLLEKMTHFKDWALQIAIDKEEEERNERINKRNKKMEIFDEDQGWIQYCQRCNTKVGDKEVCPKCKLRFTGVIRV